MLPLVKSIKGIWDRRYYYGNLFFQISLVYYLVVSTSKVSNDLKKYLLRNGIFKDCLELDVYDMMSPILSSLIDFAQDRAVTCTIFYRFQIFKP